MAVNPVKEHSGHKSRRICASFPKPVIQEERGKLQERWDRCKAIPQTHSVHFAARASASTLAVAKN